MNAAAMSERAAAGKIRDAYGVPCWWGEATRAFWAMVPAGGRLRLVEALSVREMVTAITHPGGWPWPHERTARQEMAGGHLPRGLLSGVGEARRVDDPAGRLGGGHAVGMDHQIEHGVIERADVVARLVPRP